jgi:RNA polymerase sigma-70 factor, ECF subfamily
MLTRAVLDVEHPSLTGGTLHVVPTEADLIARIRAGDESAFTDLFRRHFRALRIYAARVHGKAGTSEEIVQQVFYRIWINRERLTVTGSLAGYLYAAVRNYALNQRERAITEHAWQQVTLQEQAHEPPRGEQPDEEVIAAELAAALDRAVQQLPPRTRQAFILRRQHHLSYAEIAQIMEITPKTVEIQIGNALKALRRDLADFL